MPNLNAVDQINSTLTPSSQISASLVSENNISATLSNGITINQITGGGGGGGISAPGGANTQVQFNDDGTLGGASTVTYNKTTGTLTGTTINATIVNATFAGNGANITNLDYTKITNPPVLADVATSGDYADLSNTPVLAPVATSGDYADLSNTPVLAPVATSGDYADLSNTPVLAPVATSGDYADLSNTPVLAPVATSGLYSDLTGKPSLAPVATSGLYSDLTGKPVLGTAALVDATVFATAAQGAKADTAVQSITSTNGSIAVTGTTTRDLSVVFANQARTLFSTCRNNSGTPMTPGTVVYISTAQGSQPVITRAQANAESTSTKTYGIVSGTINNNGTGTVIVVGELTNVNTNGLATGATLYLSPTVAGGFTTTKPSAPNHIVSIGTVVYAHQNNGIIEVRIANGYELEELHNVSLNGTTNGQVLTYESATSLWKATSPATNVSQLTNDAGYTTASAVAAGYQPLDADLTGLAGLAGSGLAKRTGGVWVLDTSTYLTGITSGQITSALGYTPYSAANPDGYITAAGTVAVALVANSVAWTNVSGRPTALSQFSNDSGFITSSTANATYQAKDSDLDAIAALTTEGYARRSAGSVWTTDSSIPWASVSGKPSFATVATSGDYADLSNTPTALSEFANDSGYITAATANTNYQAKDADLTTLAGLSDNGFVKRSGGQYVIDSTSVYLTGINSTQVTDALGYTPINPTQKGAINGVASLDSTGQVPLTQLPDSLENVVTVGSYSLLPVEGVINRLYIVDDSNLAYRWDDGVYKAITATVSNTDAVAEGSVNKYFTIARARESINASGSLTYDNVTGTVSYTAPTLAPVATSGVYADLTGKPTQLSQFTNDTNFTTLSAVGAAYQPLDSDLTGLAALSGAGIARRTGGTWTLDTNAYLTSYTETDPVFVASPSYTITNTNIGNWNSAYGWGNHASAGYATTSSVAAGYQPLDSDLTSIAGLAGTSGILRKTGAGTFVLDTSTYLTSASIDNLQPLDSDLTAISNLANSPGFVKKVSDGVYVVDNSTYLTTSSASTTYQPLSSDLTAIDGLANTAGVLTKVSDGNWALNTAGFQPLDPDLTSIAALTGTSGVLRKTGAGTFVLDTTAYQPLNTGLTNFASTANTLNVGYIKKIGSNTFTVEDESYLLSSDASLFQPVSPELTAFAGLGGQIGNIRKNGLQTYYIDETIYQPENAQLYQIIGTGDNGLLKKVSGNWTLDTNTYLSTTAAASLYQTKDADLTAIAGITTYGVLKRTGDNTWVTDSTAYQPLDGDLTSIAGLTGLNGFLRKNTTNTWVLDTNVYLTQFDRAAAAGELNQGTQLNGAVGAGGGGAVRVTMNTVAQTGSIDVNVAPVTPDGEALIYTKSASITVDGVMPGADPSVGNLGRDLGSATARWRTIYLNDYYSSATEPSINFGSEFGATGFYGTGNGAYIYTTMSGVDTYITTPDYISPVLAQSGLKSLGHPSLRWRKVVLAAGTESAPAVVVGSAGSNTGLYAEVDGTISFTNAGVKTAAIDSTGLTVVGAVNGAKFKAGLGSAADAAYKISANGTSTGLYSEVEGALTFTGAGVKTGGIDSVGNLTMVGNVTAYSDIRLKEELNVITSALDKVQQLTGYTYTRKDNGERQTGLVAQDVQKVIPEAVLEGPEYLSVAYGNLMGLVVEAIKELNTKIDKLAENK